MDREADQLEREVADLKAELAAEVERLRGRAGRARRAALRRRRSEPRWPRRAWARCACDAIGRRAGRRMHERIHRAEQNELAFQSYNQRRAAAERAGQTPSDDLSSSCASATTPRAGRRSSCDWESTSWRSASSTASWCRRATEDPAVEVVVEEHDGYPVVSKPSLRRRSG